MTDHHKSRASTHAAVCWSWGHGHYECALREIEALRAEVAEWKRVAAAQAELHGEAEERAEQLAEDDAWCAECGAKLETVRPGKHQHPTCSQAALQQPAAVAQPLADEALLRQAMEALEGMEKWASSIYDGYPPSTASIAAAPYREAARAAIAKATRGEQ